MMNAASNTAKSPKKIGNPDAVLKPHQANAQTPLNGILQMHNLVTCFFLGVFAV